MLQRVFFVVAFMVTTSFSGVIAAPVSAYAEETDVDVAFNRQAYVLEMAVDDLTENTKLYLAMQKQIDSTLLEYWIDLLAEKLPSQPVAVLNIIQKSGIDIGKFCPMNDVDLEEDEVIDWNERALSALTAIQFIDPAQEKMRLECVGLIEQSMREE